MLDIAKLQKIFNSENSFTKYENGIVFNSNLSNDNGDTFVFEFVELEGKIVISDMGLTVKNLLERGFDIFEEIDLAEYSNKVMRHFHVQRNKNNELFVIASSESECPVALGKLAECITLLTFIDLQFEE